MYKRCTLLFFIFMLGAVHGAPVVSSEYENLDDRALHQTPVTFSLVGARGDFRQVTPSIDGKPLPAQVDVLRRADDGSIRHALVSFVLPNLEAGGRVKVDWLNRKPAAPPPFGMNLEKGDMELALTLTREDGRVIVSRLGDAIRGGRRPERIRRRYDGPVMKESEIVHAPRDAQNKPDGEIEVIWRLRRFTGQRSIRVSCIVERTKMVNNGRRPAQYKFKSVRLNLGKRVLFESGAYDHLWQTRYRILAWTQGPLENIHRRPNYPYLVKADCFPLYQRQGKKNLVGQFAQNPGGGNRHNVKKDARTQGIFETGIIYRDMPGTGGRWDIGPYPAWSVAYLLTGDRSLYRKILHADGNGSGSFWIHTRQDGMAGWNVFDIDPKKVPLLRNNRMDAWKLPDGSRMTLRPDHAHAPSLGYLAYILTGDRYYAEEMGFWAAYQLGEYPHKGLSLNAPARSQAWGLRHIVDAAFLLPDKDPMRSVAQRGAEKYVKAFTDQFVKSDRKVHFVQESNRFDTSGRLTWINCMRTSAWMQSWLVWSLHNAAVKGIPGAGRCRDWTAEYIIGLYTSKDSFKAPDGRTYTYDPRDAMSYSTATSLWEIKIDGDKTVPVRKIKDLDNYGEVWYWTKVNSDNMYTRHGKRKGLWSRPDENGVWPVRPDGWGHGKYDWGTGIHGKADQKRWWAWHRYGAWVALVSAAEANVKHADQVFEVMSGLAGDSTYGFEMIPAKSKGTWSTHIYKRVGDLEIQAEVFHYEDARVRPVVVWLHGGALINGHRKGISGRVKKFAQENGAVLVSFDYRLAPETKLPFIIEDVEDAFKWLRKEGPRRFNIDPERIVVTGGSAGGYLTLTAGFRVKPRPAALLAFWGYGDLIGDWYARPSPHPRHHRSNMDEEEAWKQVSGPPIANAGDRKGNGGAFYQYCRQKGVWPKAVSGWDPVKDAKKFVPYMPVRNVDKDYPPTVLIHGAADTDVPYEQSEMMARELEKQDVPHLFLGIKNAEHGLAGGDPDQINRSYEKAFDFIKAIMTDTAP